MTKIWNHGLFFKKMLIVSRKTQNYESEQYSLAKFLYFWSSFKEVFGIAASSTSCSVVVEVLARSDWLSDWLKAPLAGERGRVSCPGPPLTSLISSQTCRICGWKQNSIELSQCSHLIFSVTDYVLWLWHLDFCKVTIVKQLSVLYSK